MILNNKSRRNNVNLNSQPEHYQPVNQLPAHSNSFNDTTDTFFNESAFVPAAQSTYYQPKNIYEPINNQQHSNNYYNPNQNSNFSSQDMSTKQGKNSIRSNTPLAYQPQQPQQQPPQQQGIYNPASVNQLFNDPMASMAVQYGSSLAGQGKDYVAQNVDRWFSISKLKFYFAVDTTYVYKKILLVLFPFINTDWSIKYSQTESVPPKLDVNAPDLYIPIMSFVTYLLFVGISLGFQKKFSPELLGIQASSALGWFVIEVILIFIMMQILSIKSALKTFDIMSFCGYKYLGMIFCLVSSLVFSNSGYILVLAYMCVAITYFMVRNLKLMILASESDSHGHEDAMGGHLTGNKRRIYVLLFISLLQPLFMWWLTRHLVAVPVDIVV